MYDVIVVGARAAGAATAMLLARAGLSVLLVERSVVPSDIPHGHFVHRHGPRRLARWGVLDRVLETNCPAVTTFTMDLGDGPLTGRDLAVDGVPFGIAPRRDRLDSTLAAAAVEAGAELRDRFAVLDYVVDGERIAGIVGRDARTGAEVREHATVVVGADGRNSALARRVGAPAHPAAPTATCWYFSYWSGVACPALELHARPGRHVTFVFPTNDDLVGVFTGFPIAQLADVRNDIEGHLLAAVDDAPELAERVRAGTREERFRGATQLPNFLRRPYGPGWALVGDAGCHKDPFMALGICDALRDAELLSTALVDGLGGRSDPGDALAAYQATRDAATLPEFHANLAMAQLGPMPDDLLALRAALRPDPDATRHFFLANQGLVDPESFYNDDNIGRIMAAGARTA